MNLMIQKYIIFTGCKTLGIVMNRETIFTEHVLTFMLCLLGVQSDDMLLYLCCVKAGIRKEIDNKLPTIQVLVTPEQKNYQKFHMIEFVYDIFHIIWSYKSRTLSDRYTYTTNTAIRFNIGLYLFCWTKHLNNYCLFVLLTTFSFLVENDY